MILGLSTSAFTLLHVVLGLIGVASLPSFHPVAQVQELRSL